MHTSPYSLTDLIRDDDFITWVRRPTAENSPRWDAYIRKFPNQEKTVAMAKQYINLIAEDTGRDLPTLKRSEKMWQQVTNTIKSENSEN